MTNTTEILNHSDCINFRDDGSCKGEVAYRMAMSGTGRSFPRCDHHFRIALADYEDHRVRYPVNAPRDFDYLDAGEYWDEDY